MNTAEILRERASTWPEREAFTFAGSDQSHLWNYHALHERASQIASVLREHARKGERAVLLYPPGPDFIAALFGCFYSGTIAIPAYPPVAGKARRHFARLQGILQAAQPRIALCNASVAATFEAQKHLPEFGSLTLIDTDKLPNEAVDNGHIDAHSIAFLQFTSGSTSAPKGVIVTHDSLNHNLRAICKAFQHTHHSRGVIWLPPFHDMGLIGGILQPIFAGFPVFLMAPSAFLQEPAIWLKTISDYRATTSGGPNAAYDLCVQRVTEEQKQKLDLSCWTVAFNGAEPVSNATIDRFTQRFADCGFRRRAFLSCYGLAEATLFVSGSGHSQGAPSLLASKTGLQNGLFAPVSDIAGQTIVSSGSPDEDVQVRIVDPKTLLTQPDSTVGEVWVSGPSVAAGYWNQPELSRETFEAWIANDRGVGPYLRTGDLGFVHEGALYITGRLKDVIIKRGLNFYPQDLEATVTESHPSLQGGTAAVFGSQTGTDDELVVLHEVKRQIKDIETLREIAAAAKAAMIRDHDLAPDVIVLVKAATLPKTSSGKIQRHSCRHLYENNSLDALFLEKADKLMDHIQFPDWNHSLSTMDQTERHAQVREALSKIIIQITGRADVSTQRCDLHQLGIDSLKIVEFAHLLSRQFGVNVPLATLYQAPDIDALAAEISQLESCSTHECARRSDEHAPKAFPLSYNQKALWLLHKLQPEDSTYNVSLAALIEGPFQTNVFNVAVDDLLRRHPALRVTFDDSDVEPLQTLSTAWRTPVAVKSATTWTREELNGELGLAARKTFDLRNEIPTRFVVYELGPDQHVLFWVTHHIVCDHWSFNILYSELEELYRAHAGGTMPALEENTAGYSDFVEWQTELLKTSGGGLGDYWAATVGRFPAYKLPGQVETTVDAPAAGSRQTVLSSETVGLLRQRASELGITIQELLLATICALIHRCTNEQDIVVGIPTAGRTDARFRDVVGYCVNTIPIFVAIDSNLSLAEICCRCKQSARDAIAHQDYPLLLISEKLRSRGGRTVTPQVMFSFHDLKRPSKASPFMVPDSSFRTDWAGLTISPLPFKLTAAPSELSIRALDRGCEIIMNWDFRMSSLTGDGVESMSCAWLNLLVEMLNAPRHPIVGIPLVTADQKSRLLSQLQSLGVNRPEANLRELIFEQCARTPAHVALVCEERRITYVEMQRAAECLGAKLRPIGVGPDTCVAIALESSIEAIVAILGIWTAGGAYVVIEPTTATERAAFILSDSRAKAVVTVSQFASRFSSRLPVILLDQPYECSEIQSTSLPNTSDAESHNLAYVTYTSGSTGQPKGVMVEIRSLLNYTLAAIDRFHLTPGLHYACVSTLSADLGNTTIFGALTSGGTLHLIERNLAIDGPALSAYFKRERIDVLKIAPSHLAALHGTAIEPVMPAKKLILGGETSKREWVEKMRSINPNLEIYNHYGPTETTVGVVACSIDTSSYRPSLNNPLGIPLQNCRPYVLDSELQLLPPEFEGELFVGGYGVARGYLNRPDLTADVFLPDPYGEPGERMYRTGDRAKYLTDGQIEFLGRKDHQVKIRGFRVELSEIETAIQSVDGIRQAVVTLENGQAGVHLSAFVSTDPARAPQLETLRAALRKKLPDYMIPSRFTILDELPLNSNGKVDRSALCDLPPRTDTDQMAFEWSADEQWIRSVWRELLRVDAIGPNDDFFELGGHSLLAMQLMARLRERYRIEFSIKTFFDAPTIAGLALQARQTPLSRESEFIPAADKCRRGYFPLSHAQERLWAIDQMDPGNHAYNRSGAIRVHGKLDSLAAEKALNEIIRRHEILRTAFDVVDGAPKQIVQATCPVIPLQFDFQTINACDQEARISELLQSESLFRFDLTSPPLIRMAIVRLSEFDHVIIFTLHHIIFDGWSGGIFIREFSACYSALVKGDQIHLPPLKFQYGEFAETQRAQLDSSGIAPHLNYWISKLEGVEDLQLPTDYPRPSLQRYNGASVTIGINADRTMRLCQLAQSHSCTLFMVLSAAFKVLLSRYTGQSDICVGTPVANRPSQEIESLIGFFINTVALRTHVSTTLSVREFLARERETILDSFEHQTVPFEKVVEAIQAHRDPSRSPVFQVMLVLQNTPVATFDLDGARVDQMWSERNTAKFDLVLTLQESGAELTGVLEYNTDLFSANTATLLARRFEAVISGMVGDPGQKIGDIEILTADEQYRLLVDWNNTGKEGPPDQCIHELFEAQVERTPERLAVACGDQTFSYRQLNCHANRIAHRLLAQNIGSGDRVGILLRRSTLAVQAILGVLKAGAAYVPLDPSVPQQRLSRMAVDAGINLVITNNAIVGELQQDGVKTLVVGEEFESEEWSEDNPGRTASPGEQIYVIFTSGSTGVPKGAAVYHRGFTNLVRWFITEFGVSSQDRALLMTSLSFDLTQKNLYATLVCGGSLHILPDGPYDPEAINDVIEQQKITLLNTTPSGFYPLLDQGEQFWPKLNSLRHVFLGGEPILPHRIGAWLNRRNYEPEIVNTYGPTECTDIAAFHRISKSSIEAGQTIPIGRPIANVQMILLDKDFRLCPPGIVAEICIGGAGVGAGYANDPALTAQKFIPHPFAKEPGERLYRTGDIGRQLEDGSIVFLGRADHQVKLRGFRIELGDIEACLHSHEEVQDCIAVAHTQEDESVVIAAYVIATPGSQLTEKTLSHFAAERLPEYMTPTSYVFLEKWPLTPNGKVDRRRLPPPETRREAPYEPPRNELESKLVAIWEDVLKRKVGIHDHFFHVGGNSLSMARVTSRLRAELGINVPLTRFFQRPTIAELAELAGLNPPPANREVEALLNELENLTDAELDRRLQTIAAK